MPAFVDTTFNVVHVDDLAAGHLLALESGRVGRSYIIGGENLPMREFLAVLAGCTGLPAPSRQVPKSVALSVGGLSQLVEGRLLRREPSVALEAARMSTTNMMFSIDRAPGGARLRPAPSRRRDCRFGPLVRRERLCGRQAAESHQSDDLKSSDPP